MPRTLVDMYDAGELRPFRLYRTYSGLLGRKYTYVYLGFGWAFCLSDLHLTGMEGMRGYIQSDNYIKEYIIE